MTTKIIPLSMHSIREHRPTHKFRQPGQVPLLVDANNDKQALLRGPFSGIPEDATITSAKVRVYTERAHAFTPTLSVAPNTSDWHSGVTWDTKPTLGATIVTDSHANPGIGTLFEFDVTAWADTRPTQGLRLRTNGANKVWVAGATASLYQPVMVVEYAVLPDTPGHLMPSGGVVSVAKPPLTYVGDDLMAEQNVQLIVNGGATNDSGWLVASEGYLVQPGGWPSPSSGQDVDWRVRVRNAEGTSEWSPWVTYSYIPLPTLTITNPPAAPATTPDGTPPLTWTVATQGRWKAELTNDDTGQVVDDTDGWVDESATRSWTPSKGVKMPGGNGTFRLVVDDGEPNRISSSGTSGSFNREATRTFLTAFSGNGNGVTTIAAALVDGVVHITGTRAGGTPDQVVLYRDGIQVPIWDVDGDPSMEVDGADVFNGTDYDVPDYTADLRHEHTWQVIPLTGGTAALNNPAVIDTFSTPDVWLVNPRSGNSIQVLGLNAPPVIEQTTAEQSILHTPISGGLIVEPVRRRLVRTTRQGTIQGLILGTDEATFDNWVTGPAGNRFRLIFGKANLSVILGDYSPADVFYPEGDACNSPDRVLVACTWWQRKDD